MKKIKKSLPKISIVTPSYNQGAFIEETILSVINQNYPNLEYIIMDGGSTDNTVEIIKKYEDNINYWVSEPDKGQSDAINKGFNIATGDIYYWINSDDYLLPNALNTIAEINWSEKIGAVVGIGHKINLNKEIIYTPEYYEPITSDTLFYWTRGKNFMQPACFFTKITWQECGPLNVNLNYCMDVDFWIKISKIFEYKRVNKSLAHAYVHDEAKTTADIEKMNIETYLMYATHGELSVAREAMYTMYFNLQKVILKRSLILKTLDKLLIRLFK